MKRKDRNTVPKVRNPKLGTRNPEPGIRNLPPRSAEGGPRPLTRGPQTVHDVLGWADSALRDAGVSNPQFDTRLLLAKATARSLAWLLAHPECEVDPSVRAVFAGWVEQRAAGRPIAYLIGHREFYGRDFVVSPAVLIPRPETELLIEQGLKVLGVRCQVSGNGEWGPGIRGWGLQAGDQGPAVADPQSPTTSPQSLLLADIGTGSGCIAVTLAAEVPQAQVVATDISDAALQVARENAARHGVADRVAFHYDDLLPQGTEQFDAVFSNPPYVAAGDAQLAEEVRKNEPGVALFGGAGGMELYERIVPLAAQRLKPGGWLVIELGYQSRQKVRALFKNSLWQSVQVFPDLQGIARCLIAQRRK